MTLLHDLMFLSSNWRWVETKSLGAWATPKAGDAAEAGDTDKQQAGWPSLTRQAQRVLIPAPWATPQASDGVEGARTALTSRQKCLGRDIKYLILEDEV